MNKDVLNITKGNEHPEEFRKLPEWLEKARLTKGDLYDSRTNIGRASKLAYYRGCQAQFQAILKAIGEVSK